MNPALAVAVTSRWLSSAMQSASRRAEERLRNLRGPHLCGARTFCYGGVVGLREQKKLATRAALGWAAIRLIVERGYDKVLVEDIAAEAGVSPRTFNNYFGSKAEAVASRHLDRIHRMAEALRERPADEPLWDSIEHVMLES